MTPDPAVGTRLRAARLGAGLTRDRLAVGAEIGSATVTRIENGHCRPNRSTMRALAAALDCTVEDLFPAEDPLNADAPVVSGRVATTSTGAAGPRDSAIARA